MFVVSRVMKLEKGNFEQSLMKAKAPSVVESFPGFIRRDILVDTSKKDVDVIRIFIYWKNKEAYYQWHKSPEHMNLHKQGGKSTRPTEVVEVLREQYELVYSTVNDED